MPIDFARHRINSQDRWFRQCFINSSHLNRTDGAAVVGNLHLRCYNQRTSDVALRVVGQTTSH
uniref:Uncharacterized protein n=1 Tax=Physcomitrium patens TaxID=3218 RepID=A0A2K1L3Q1_PHYPA|nr:hypothetical protein PHYPA_003447 [Physcomitrium patens]